MALEVVKNLFRFVEALIVIGVETIYLIFSTAESRI